MHVPMDTANSKKVMFDTEKLLSIFHHSLARMNAKGVGESGERGRAKGVAGERGRVLPFAFFVRIGNFYESMCRIFIFLIINQLAMR